MKSYSGFWVAESWIWLCRSKRPADLTPGGASLFGCYDITNELPSSRSRDQAIMAARTNRIYPWKKVIVLYENYLTVGFDQEDLWFL